MSYETNLRRIEEIVTILERCDTSVEVMLKLFEEGTDLLSECFNTLNNTAKRIQEIMKQFQKHDKLKNFHGS